MKKGQIDAQVIIAVFGIVLVGIVVLATLQGFTDSGVLGTDTFAANATQSGQQLFDNFYDLLVVLGTALAGVLIFAVVRRAGLA